MFNLTRKPSKERGPHLKACSLSLTCNGPTRAVLCHCKRPCFWLFGAASLAQSWRVSEVHRNGRVGRTKRLMNGKANCFTILKRIARLKCVSSEVSQSAFTLKRVPSLGSMAPCRSHRGNHTRQELDHGSDPSGTESQNVRINKISDMAATSCDLNAPRWSRGGVFIDHRPPGTPVIPCSNKIYK